MKDEKLSITFIEYNRPEREQHGIGPHKSMKTLSSG
jgi:hypothetical protein